MSHPVPLAPGVWRLPTVGNLINSFAFEEADGRVTLVDAGLRGATKTLVTLLGEMGKRPEDVGRIVITHAHVDHVGDARALRERTGGRLAIHDADAEYCRTGRNPPQDPRQPLGPILGLFRSPNGGGPVDETFADDDLLDVGGGLRVLHTPGHSPGHCAFLHERSGVLITGDALFNFMDRMSFSWAIFCTDIAQSRRTADRLGEVDYEIAAFTHGPEIRHRARERVRDYLRRSRAG